MAVLSEDQALQIDMLAQLMNYAMSKTVIARSYFRHTFSRVVNISMGGLLFELNNRTIFDYLTFHDHLKMEIQIRHHLMHLSGEITRYYPTREGFNIGVRFYQSGPDDYKVLQNFVAEKKSFDVRIGRSRATTRHAGLCARASMPEHRDASPSWLRCGMPPRRARGRSSSRRTLRISTGFGSFRRLPSGKPSDGLCMLSLSAFGGLAQSFGLLVQKKGPAQLRSPRSYTNDS